MKPKEDAEQSQLQADRAAPATAADLSNRSSRRNVLLTVFVVALAAGAVIGLSVAGAETEPGSEPFASEKVTIDGVDVYRSELPNGGPAVYTFQPPSETDIASAETIPSDSVGGTIGQTTGDLAACNFLVEQPGPVVKGCAQMLAQERYGDLHLTDGPPQLVYSECGQEPTPGVIADCGDGLIEEAQVADARDELRAALEETK